MLRDAVSSYWAQGAFFLHELHMPPSDAYSVKIKRICRLPRDQKVAVFTYARAEQRGWRQSVREPFITTHFPLFEPCSLELDTFRDWAAHQLQGGGINMPGEILCCMLPASVAHLVAHNQLHAISFRVAWHRRLAGVCLLWPDFPPAGSGGSSTFSALEPKHFAPLTACTMNHLAYQMTIAAKLALTGQASHQMMLSHINTVLAWAGVFAHGDEVFS
jgi:hypothetical protein